MNIQSAFNAGLQGFNQAKETVNQAASDIARSTAYHSENNNETIQTTPLNNGSVSDQQGSSQNLPSLTESIVSLKVAEHQASASARVIKTADETLGTLLDVSV